MPESTEMPGVRSLTPPRSREVSADFSSGLITSKPSSTWSTPSRGCERLLDLLLEARAERRTRHREGDHDRHVTAVDDDVANHVQLDHRAAELGVENTLERSSDLFARDHETLG